MTRKRNLRKKRTRRRMHGRGQATSFIAKNLNRSDALAIATASLRPLSNLFTPADMSLFLQMEQKLSDDATRGNPADAATSHLAIRAQQLLDKYTAERAEYNAREQAARIAAMGPVERAGLIGKDSPVATVYPTSPPLLPSLPSVPAISPRRSAGGRRTRRRRR